MNLIIIISYTLIKMTLSLIIQQDQQLSPVFLLPNETRYCFLDEYIDGPNISYAISSTNSNNTINLKPRYTELNTNIIFNESLDFISSARDTILDNLITYYGFLISSSKVYIVDSLTWNYQIIILPVVDMQSCYSIRNVGRGLFYVDCSNFFSNNNTLNSSYFYLINIQNYPRYTITTVKMSNMACVLNNNKSPRSIEALYFNDSVSLLIRFYDGDYVSSKQQIELYNITNAFKPILLSQITEKSLGDISSYGFSYTMKSATMSVNYALNLIDILICSSLGNIFIYSVTFSIKANQNILYSRSSYNHVYLYQYYEKISRIVAQSYNSLQYIAVAGENNLFVHIASEKEARFFNYFSIPFSLFNVTDMAINQEFIVASIYSINDRSYYLIAYSIYNKNSIPYILRNYDRITAPIDLYLYTTSISNFIYFTRMNSVIINIGDPYFVIDSNNTSDFTLLITSMNQVYQQNISMIFLDNDDQQIYAYQTNTSFLIYSYPGTANITIDVSNRFSGPNIILSISCSQCSNITNHTVDHIALINANFLTIDPNNNLLSQLSISKNIMGYLTLICWWANNTETSSNIFFDDEMDLRFDGVYEKFITYNLSINLAKEKYRVDIQILENSFILTRRFYGLSFSFSGTINSCQGLDPLTYITSIIYCWINDKIVAYTSSNLNGSIIEIGSLQLESAGDILQINSNANSVNTIFILTEQNILICDMYLKTSCINTGFINPSNDTEMIITNNTILLISQILNQIIEYDITSQFTSSWYLRRTYNLEDYIIFTNNNSIFGLKYEYNPQSDLLLLFIQDSFSKIYLAIIKPGFQGNSYIRRIIPFDVDIAQVSCAYIYEYTLCAYVNNGTFKFFKLIDIYQFYTQYISPPQNTADFNRTYLEINAKNTNFESTALKLSLDYIINQIPLSALNQDIEVNYDTSQENFVINENNLFIGTPMNYTSNESYCQPRIVFNNKEYLKDFFSGKDINIKLDQYLSTIIFSASNAVYKMNLDNPQQIQNPLQLPINYGYMPIAIQIQQYGKYYLVIYMNDDNNNMLIIYNSNTLQPIYTIYIQEKSLKNFLIINDFLFILNLNGNNIVFTIHAIDINFSYLPKYSLYTNISIDEFIEFEVLPGTLLDFDISINPNFPTLFRIFLLGAKNLIIFDYDILITSIKQVYLVDALGLIWQYYHVPNTPIFLNFTLCDQYYTLEYQQHYFYISIQKAGVFMISIQINNNGTFDSVLEKIFILPELNYDIFDIKYSENHLLIMLQLSNMQLQPLNSQTKPYSYISIYSTTDDLLYNRVKAYYLISFSKTTYSSVFSNSYNINSLDPSDITYFYYFTKIPSLIKLQINSGIKVYNEDMPYRYECSMIISNDISSIYVKFPTRILRPTDITAIVLAAITNLIGIIFGLYRKYIAW